MSSLAETGIQPANTALYFLQGGGEMGALIRSIDWSGTPIGAPAKWPEPLKVCVSLMLNSDFPICIAWGPQLIQLYNDAFRPVMAPGRQALAAGAAETFAEVWDVLEAIADEVWQGHAVRRQNLRLMLERQEQQKECFFEFCCSPVKCGDGTVGGMLVTLLETTEGVEAFNHLVDTKTALERANAEIEVERDRFRSLVEQAPVALLVNRGEELTFDIINEDMIRLIGRGESVRGRALFDVIPELRGQAIVENLYHTYRSGEESVTNEQPVTLYEEGVPKVRYFNVTYRPLRENGVITGVLEAAVEVTEQVCARNQLQRTKDALKLAIEAAELGMFDVDLVNDTMYWDERCRALFGISHHDPLSFREHFVSGLHPDDRNRVLDLIHNTVFNQEKSNGDYDVEYRTVGLQDEKVRWIRAKGKAYFDQDGRPVRFIGVILDISEQKNDELRKSDFIGMVSHELKTPLTSLTALVQILQGKIRAAEEDINHVLLQKANRQVKKMSALINSFLNVSRLESGKIQLNKQDFDLYELIEEVVEESRIMMPTHEIRAHQCRRITVFADREKIGAVLSNLLNNAVKYSPKGKHITVSCRAEAAEVRVSVTDEGMGIRSQDLDKIFDRYYRVESNHRASISGFGIGLYLSAEIVKRHKGKIGAESEVGKGSTFWFTLPANRERE